jgi:hypothetical protein
LPAHAPDVQELVVRRLSPRRRPIMVIDSTTTTKPATSTGSTQFIFNTSPLGLVK